MCWNGTFPVVICNNYTLEWVFAHISELALDEQEKTLLRQSYDAFQAAQPSPHEMRTAAMLSGYVVSDSESDSASEYISLKSLSDERARKILSKKRRALARRIRWQKSKAIAESNFLGRKKSRSIQSVEQKFPDIGISIEDYSSWKRFESIELR